MPDLPTPEPQTQFTDGAAYERLMGPWSRAAGELFLDWLSPPPGLRWLDVGCGTGVFTKLIVDRAAPGEVTAVDPAADQIAYARTKPFAQRVTFDLGDAQALPFADRAFDVAAMALVIAFIPDPAKAVSEMRRVVRPGGLVATYVWDSAGKGSPPQPLSDALEAMGIAVPARRGHANSRLDNLRRFFAEAGLAEIATRTIEPEVAYPDFDAYWSAQTGFGNSVGQRIRRMSPAEVRTFKAHLRRLLPTDGAGRIAYRARANAAKARVPR